jgi:hypothetical protein
VRTVRLLWVEPPHALLGVEAGVDDALLDRRVIESGMAADFPGPSGRYVLLAEEIWRTLTPDEPVPVFLHEAYEAALEKWVNSLPDAAAEVAIVARVRDAIMQLVETRLAGDPQAVSASPTVTTTEPTPQGMAVVGRCVVLRPARARHGSGLPPVQRRPPRAPGS